MRKVLLILIVVVSIALGYSLKKEQNLNTKEQVLPSQTQKKPLLRIALVADSHSENELLAKALRQAQGHGINFVIGLGDYTNLGTVGELRAAKREFDKSGLQYFVTAGDRDGWESRQNGLSSNTNFVQVFGQSSHVFQRNSMQFVILDNSDIYSGISQEDWEILNSKLEIDRLSTKERNSKLTFVFAHKTPFHPESRHVMGEDSAQVAEQAKRLMGLLEQKKVDGFFSGDIHFFAQYQSMGGSVKITTIGAVASARNFQGPRFGVLTVWDDYSWQVEDVEIR